MQTLAVSYDNIEAILEGSGIAEVSFPDEYKAGPGAAAQSNELLAQASRSPRAPTVAVQAPLIPGKYKLNPDSETNEEGSRTPTSSFLATPTSSSLATPRLQASEARHEEGASTLQSPHTPNRNPLLSQAPQSQRSSGLFTPLPVERRPSSPAHAGQLELGANEQASTSYYTALLSRVIEIARRSSLPHKSSLRMARLRRAVNRLDGQQDPDETTTLFASNKLERDMMIDAAGELYVG
jgi:hypothetical protein